MSIFILSLFLSYSQCFVISVYSSGLILLYVETFAKGFSLLRFWGVRSSFNGIFQLI